MMYMLQESLPVTLLHKRLRKPKSKHFSLVCHIFKHYTQAHTIIITNAIMSKKKRKRRGSKFFFTPHIKTCFLLISRISKEHLWQARKRASRCETIFSAVICGKNVISNLTSNQNKMSSEVNDEYKSWATIKEGYSFYCRDLYCCPCGKYLWKVLLKKMRSQRNKNFNHI